MEPNSARDENIRAVVRIQQKTARERTLGQRISDGVASLAARQWVVGFHLLWFVAWIVLNVRLLPIAPFDPFPFSLLTMCVSLEAIFLSLFVLGSQNRLTRDAERRAQLDLQVDLLAEQEMTLLLQMLREVCDHLGLHETIRSPKFEELVRRTDVSELAERLDHNIGLNHKH